MSLSRKEAIKRHRELWYKIAELLKDDQFVDFNAGCLKSIALKELGYNYLEVKNVCWCCQYVLEKEYPFDCKHCPIQWNDDKRSSVPCIDSDKSPYTNFILCYDNVDKIELALKIAELPEKEEK